VHDKSIALLNQAVAEELTAVHQYMYFHFHCDNQGYDPLSALFRAIAIQEMLHAERLAERILFLDGEVEMVLAAPVQKIHDVGKMLEMARKLEEEAIVHYNQFANQCAAHGDAVSKRLFEDILVDEERHYNQFDQEIDNLTRFGQNYLALQSIERAKAQAAAAPPEAPGA